MKKTQTNQSVCSTPEIMGAFFSHDSTHDSDFDVVGMEGNPKDFIFSKYNVDVGNKDIHIVANEGETINLVLPYYEAIESVNIQALANDELDDVVGGEIWLIALFVSATVAGVAGGISILGAGAGALAKSNK